MSVTISKEFRWEMGHRLPYHDAGCENLHGHSYRMEVVVVGEQDDAGMVVDFGLISAAVRPLLEKWDHSFMVKDDDAVVLDFLTQHKLKATVVPWHSTAENIAAHLCEKLSCALGQTNVRQVGVRVYETVSSMAEVWGPVSGR